MPEAAIPPVRRLNDMPPAAFAETARALFERAPRFLARLARERPFDRMRTLFRAARRIALEMPRDEQVELLNAHPRIGADPAAVSSLSYREQGYDRAPAQADAEIGRRLHELNEAYEGRFGFRFVIFVAGRPRSAIIPFLEDALEARPENELRRGLHDVVSIAEDRLRSLRGGPRRRPTIGP
ncbi:MAG: 2-oxo-4-hydroxy-4-carboxy-5-ureidoimidazoline decarboxylase [Chloroflexi bacterium]|nr:2-oxo-4-hydroxy-4-carboxy-5-ureidoimidazoline decarboxylase [Chloroflexota bacterium]